MAPNSDMIYCKQAYSDKNLNWDSIARTSDGLKKYNMDRSRDATKEILYYISINPKNDNDIICLNPISGNKSIYWFYGTSYIIP